MNNKYFLIPISDKNVAARSIQNHAIFFYFPMRIASEIQIRMFKNDF